MNGWTIDWTVIWTTVFAAVTGLAGYLKGRKPSAARVEAAVAQAKAETAASIASTSMADAEGKLYQRLSDRITAQDRAIANLEARFQYALRHIWQLETLMRQAGITPPPFDPSMPAPNPPPPE